MKKTEGILNKITTCIKHPICKDIVTAAGQMATAVHTRLKMKSDLKDAKLETNLNRIITKCLYGKQEHQVAAIAYQTLKELGIPIHDEQEITKLLKGYI